MSTASPALDVMRTGSWSVLTCSSRGKRRCRASLALIVMTETELLCRTEIPYQYGTQIRYQRLLASDSIRMPQIMRTELIPQRSQLRIRFPLLTKMAPGDCSGGHFHARWEERPNDQAGGVGVMDPM